MLTVRNMLVNAYGASADRTLDRDRDQPILIYVSDCIDRDTSTYRRTFLSAQVAFSRRIPIHVT
ncbi:MAG: hypothetical protein ACREJU_10355, partial [Nitrospiraceae bacterium]